jgi:hypothetical protein
VTSAPAVTEQTQANLDLIHTATEANYRPLLTATVQHREVTAWVRRDIARAS